MGQKLTSLRTMQVCRGSKCEQNRGFQFMSASLLIPEVRMESLEVVRTGVIPAPKTGASNPVKQCRRIATRYDNARPIPRLRQAHIDLHLGAR